MALIGWGGVPRPVRLGIAPALGYILGGTEGARRGTAGPRADHQGISGAGRPWPY